MWVFSMCIFKCLSSIEFHLQQVNFVDLKARKIDICPPMQTGRCEHSSIVHDNFLYVAGGMKSGKHLDSVEKYEKSNEFVQIAHLIFTIFSFQI